MTIPIKIISKEEYLRDNPKPNQEEIWNKIAVPWKTYVVKKIPIVEEFLKDKKGKIVDLGCGSGRNMIVGPDKEYYGVDFSEVQLKNAEKLTEYEGINVQLFKSGLEELPSEFKDEMFDYGLFMATLHCLESADARLSALREFRRVLKPNAEGLISVWSSDDVRFNGLKGDIYMSWKEDGIPYMRYYYLYSREELIRLLKSVGFEVLEIYESRKEDRFSRKNWILKVKKTC